VASLHLRKTGHHLENQTYNILAMKIIPTKFVALSLFLLLACTTIFAYTKYSKKTALKKAKIAVIDSVKTPVLDVALLERFKKVCEKLDVNRKEFLLTGVINATDGADTSEHLDKTTYIYSRKNQLMYTRMGEVEIFNTKEHCITVNHQQKKILLSSPKEVVSASLFPDIKKLGEFVLDEGYTIKSVSDSNNETISLVNPNHISCKAYRVTFDASSLKPKLLHFRMSSFYEAEDPKMDKIVDFYINQASSNSEIDHYLSKKVVIKQDRQWRLTPQFDGYQLINIFK